MLSEHRTPPTRHRTRTPEEVTLFRGLFPAPPHPRPIKQPLSRRSVPQSPDPRRGRLAPPLTCRQAWSLRDGGLPSQRPAGSRWVRGPSRPALRPPPRARPAGWPARSSPRRPFAGSRSPAGCRYAQNPGRLPDAVLGPVTPLDGRLQHARQPAIDDGLVLSHRAGHRARPELHHRSLCGHLCTLQAGRQSHQALSMSRRRPSAKRWRRAGG